MILAARVGLCPPPSCGTSLHRAKTISITPPSPPNNTHGQFPPSAPTQSLTNRPQADKLRAQQQLEQLQARYVGTGHADTTRYEWTSNVARDSLSSYVGHAPLLQYMALGMGEPREKLRAMLIDVRPSSFPSLFVADASQRMIQPVGKPPEVQE
jgi:splicing factor 3B subunit 5